MLSVVRSALVLMAFAGVSYGFASNPIPASESLPLTFEANRGQAPLEYQYILRRGLDAGFFDRGVDFVMPVRNGGRATLRLEFLGTDSQVKLAPERPLKAQSNYLLGADPSKFITHVPNYDDLRYNNIYRGVTLDFYGNRSGLEHDFTIAPHADPSTISFRFEGAKRVVLTPDGNLVIHLSDATLTLRKPVAYQGGGDERHAVAADFKQKKDGSLGFRVGRYDARRPLIIDPVFAFSTYLDGSYADQVAAVTTDLGGNIYLTGTTGSNDFPTRNPEQSQLGCNPSGTGGCQNAFVVKLDPTGKTLIYSTYVGGSEQDFGGAIAVDSSGNAIIGGVSSSPNFPNTGSLTPMTCQINGSCYFLASLRPDGSALNYSGLIGGGEGTYSNGNNGRIAVDASGNSYLAGITDSPNFEITSGTLTTTVPGYPYDNMFVLKVDPTGKLLYSTIIPGIAPQNPAIAYNNLFIPTAIAVDSSGQVTASGTAGQGLPTTAGVVGSTFPNSTNSANPIAGFVLQLNASASAINFATYVPGTDTLGGMAIDSSGDVYAAGDTYEIDLPVSANAYQRVAVKDQDGGYNSGYIVKLNSNGTAVVAATYLDGTNSTLNNGTSLASVGLDSQGNVFVGGSTGSSDFPLLNPFTAQFETGSTIAEMVLVEMSPDLSVLKFGSFLSATDGVYPGSTFSGLTVDSSNNLIVAGTTYASTFPTTTGSFQTQPPPSPTPRASYVHSFVSKMNLATPAPSVCSTTWSISFGTIAALTSSQQILNITNCGNAALNLNSITSSVKTISASQSCGSIAPGATCPVTLTFAPVDDSVSSGTISIADNAVISPQVFQVYGQGQAPDLEPYSNPFSFGHLLAGTQGPAETLILVNRGNAPLTITGVAVSGSGFSIEQNACTIPVTQQAICSVNMAFSPAAAGSFTGTLTINSNDPVHPKLVVGLTGTGDSTYGAPSISEVTGTANQYPMTTMQTNNGPVTLGIAGNNFYPQSVVQFNGVTQQSTFTSNSSLQVTIAASSLTSMGEFPLTVTNPAPGGGATLPVTMTTFQVVPLYPSAISSVPATGLLYAAMPTSDPTNPNTVIPIHPSTGALGTPIAVGNNPSLLAASSDGAYLYVANATDLTVQRINLQTNKVERTFSYAPNASCNSCAVPAATDLKSIPGTPKEVVLAQGSQVALYNDSGLVNYAPNSFVEYNAPQFDSIAFAGAPLALYAEPFTSVQKPFFTTAAITSSGLQYTEFMGANYGPPSGTGNQVVSDGTLLYTNSGEVWNPATQTQVGSFPASVIYDTFGDLVLDTNLGQIYLTGLGNFTLPGGGSYSTMGVSSYGQHSLAALQTLTFPQINSAENYDLVRWGANGFGFVVSPFGTTGGIYLFQSSALTDTAIPNPVPVLKSTSPTQIAAGSTAFTLTINGTGFVHNSTVDWNGNALVTAYVSATQLTATVPASDLVSEGTPQITVASPNPGGGTSSALTFTVTPAVPAASLSQSSLSFGSIAQGNSSSAQSVTLTNSGTAALSITSIAASANFSETNNCGSNLAVGASCQVSVIFAPASAGAVAGSLTITDSAPGSPQTVNLSGTGVAPISVGAGSGGSTLATVTSGGTATYNLSLTGASGFSGNVSLRCSGAPQDATCSINPATIDLSSGGSANFTVTVTTSQSTSAAVRHHSTPHWEGFGFAALLLIPLFMQTRKRLRRGTLFLIAMCLVLTVSGCGSGGNNQTTTSPVTPAGTYTLTVTAATSSSTVNQILTMVVQ